MKLKWQFGESLDKLEKEVDEIVGNITINELLYQLPYEIPYNDIQTAKLVISKLGDIVWQISYVVYIEPKTKHFEKRNITSVTQPSLKLALYEMVQKIK